jgi:enoyl-[acyl-carrier-protein] reductase (NADH)
MKPRSAEVIVDFLQQEAHRTIAFITTAWREYEAAISEVAVTSASLEKISILQSRVEAGFATLTALVHTHAFATKQDPDACIDAVVATLREELGMSMSSVVALIEKSRDDHGPN